VNADLRIVDASAMNRILLAANVVKDARIRAD
jgi:hypothetical protein